MNDISLQPGLNSITLTAEDEAGNTSQDNVAVTYTPFDADSDGIPDDWERLHFGGLDTASAGSDTGNTGTPDFLKHAFGIDPVTPDLRGLPHMDSRSDGQAAVPVFKYRRLIAPDGLVYRVGVSENLHDWDWSGMRIEQLGIPTPTGDGITEEVTVRFRAGTGTPPGSAFFRLHVLIAPTDSDEDGIADSWELDHFGRLDAANALTDSGNMGLPDLLKFAFGMDMDSMVSDRLPRLTMVPKTDGPVPRFEYHRLISPGLLIYQVGVSDDLQNWDWSGHQLTGLGSPQSTGDGLTERVALSLRELPAAGSGPKFMRLRVIGGR